MTQTQKPLREILYKIEELNQMGRKSLVVFDLDSTLFDVSPRIQKILWDFAELPEIRQNYPESAEILKNIRTERADWGIKHAIIRAGLDKHHPDFLEKIRDFWKANFFSNPYLEYDVPFDGAVEFCQELVRCKAHLAYLTGRDVLRMGEGSLKVLKKWNFPVDDLAARLVLKPKAGMDDAAFKSDWFAALPEGVYNRIWFFENEPANVHAVRAAHQHIDVVFFESTHSGRAEPPLDLPRIMHFLLED